MSKLFLKQNMSKLYQTLVRREELMLITNFFLIYLV